MKAKEVASPNAFTLRWSGVGQGGVTPLRLMLEERNEFLATKTDIPDLRLLIYGRVPMLATLRRFNGRMLGDHGFPAWCSFLTLYRSSGMSGSRKGTNKRNQEVSEFLKGAAGPSIPAS